MLDMFVRMKMYSFIYIRIWKSPIIIYTSIIYNILTDFNQILVGTTSLRKYICYVINKEKIMNNELCQIENLANLIQVLKDIIPEGIEEKLEADGIQVSLIKRDGDIKINVTSEEKPFNDSEVKEYISNFKSNIEALDDSLFVKVTEEFSKTFDTKEFNNLLELDSYTKQEAEKVAEMISEFSDIVCKNLQCEIEKLVELYERF